MNLKELKLRCYAKQDEPDHWYAVCLDLCLIANGYTFSEAKNKLNDMT